MHVRHLTNTLKLNQSCQWLQQIMFQPLLVYIWRFCLTLKELFYCFWVVFSCLKIVINAVLKILTKGRQRSEREVSLWASKEPWVPWRLQTPLTGGTDCDAYDTVFRPPPPGEWCDPPTDESGTAGSHIQVSLRILSHMCGEEPLKITNFLPVK